MASEYLPSRDRTWRFTRLRKLELLRECAEAALLAEGLKDIWVTEEVGDSEDSLSRALKELVD